jgi:hypothetical protein
MTPVRLGKKKYKSFGKAVSAVARKKHIGKKRAAAYVATVERTIRQRRAAKRKRK